MGECMARRQNNFINSCLDWVVQRLNECENGWVDRWRGSGLLGKWMDG